MCCLVGKMHLTEEEQKTEMELKVQKINTMKWRPVTRRVACHVPGNPHRLNDWLMRPLTAHIGRSASGASEGGSRPEL